MEMNNYFVQGQNANPFLSLTPAQVDVLEDMIDEWMTQDRHGGLNGGWGYGPKKTEALSQLSEQIYEAWKAVVKYQDVEEMGE